MSKKALTLDEPIEINGKQVTELTYDPMAITAAQFYEACARSSAIDKNKSFSFKMRENDYALHLYLGMMAVIAVNPDIDISALERLKGFDVLELADIGMLFILRRWGQPPGKAALRSNPRLQPSVQRQHQRRWKHEAD